jgi:hypothetical protein
LITEQTCFLAMFLDAGTNVFVDYSRFYNQGIGFDVTKNGADGCAFPNAGSHVLVSHDSSQAISQGTVAVYGEFAASPASLSTLVDKGTNFKLDVSTNQIIFNGQILAHTFDNNQHIAVTFKDGYKPRCHVDGIYIGEFTNNYTATPAITDDITIGNSNGLTTQSDVNIKQVYLGNQPLDDREILALFESAQEIGATPMEVGNRLTVRSPFAGTAVAVDFEPAGHFQLIDVALQFDVAPTTAEDLVIQTTTDDGDTIEEHREDLSLLGTTKPTPFRFDKRFTSGRNIKIDYPNTDANTIVVLTTYQIDQSVV